MSTTTFESGHGGARRAKGADLTSSQRLLVGGLGGITPIIATLMAGEYENLPLLDYQGLEFYIGYGLRIMLFFCVGALFVWLHQEVRGRYPVFRLGVTAPALIAAMMGTAPAEAAESHAASAFGGTEARVVSLHSFAASGAMPDALLAEGILHKRCGILDGFLGRKCTKPRKETDGNSGR